MRATSKVPDDGREIPAAEASGPAAASPLIATDRDPAGVPVHRGWAPVGGHRWMEPFVMVLLAGGAAQGTRSWGAGAAGYHERVRGRGLVYRMLRDLEAGVRSSWTTGTARTA
jgi:hypothetical protein